MHYHGNGDKTENIEAHAAVKALGVDLLVICAFTQILLEGDPLEIINGCS